MLVQPFFVQGLAHSSYLLGGSEHCAIVDPRRDVDLYLETAKELGLRITHVLETHLHADFVSGHRELAAKAGAKVYAPRLAGCAFEHVPLSEGDRFLIDDVEVRVLETPGHTPEHVSFVAVDRARGSEPVSAFCGDTLFVGDVGRPDLFPGRAEELASKLFDSLHEKLLSLPDHCELYPAHGAGSLCGRAIGAKRTSTIGYERRYNAMLQLRGREEFIGALTTDMPAAPDHFARCSAINGGGPALLQSLEPVSPLSPAAFRDRAQKAGAIVLDTRGYDAFGGQHVPGAYHIDLGGNFATFAGWVLPPEQGIFLVADSAKRGAEAALLLRRVGLDLVGGYLEGGMYEWSKTGLPTRQVPQCSAEALQTRISGGEPLTLLDARTPREYRTSSIRGAVNIPVPDLRTRHGELDPSYPVVVLCASGQRSSLGASLLLQRGFERVFNLAGGLTGFAAAGFSPECPDCVLPHGPDPHVRAKIVR
jgi:hydroxyacylglutathione hydrolase